MTLVRVKWIQQTEDKEIYQEECTMDLHKLMTLFHIKERFLERDEYFTTIILIIVNVFSSLKWLIMKI